MVKPFMYKIGLGLQFALYYNKFLHADTRESNACQVSSGHSLESTAFLSSRLGKILCRNPAPHPHPPSRQVCHGWCLARREKGRVERSPR